MTKQVKIQCTYTLMAHAKFSDGSHGGSADRSRTTFAVVTGAGAMKALLRQRCALVAEETSKRVLSRLREKPKEQHAASFVPPPLHDAQLLELICPAPSNGQQVRTKKRKQRPTQRRSAPYRQDSKQNQRKRLSRAISGLQLHHLHRPTSKLPLLQKATTIREGAHATPRNRG